MKRFALLCALVVCFAGVASAQDYSKVDIFAGYSFVHTSESGAGFNFNGGSASAAYNVNSWLGLVGDFGGYESNSFGFGETVYTYMFGPRVNLRKGKFTPFAQALFGGAHLSAAGCESCEDFGGENGFAMALGGGLDYNVTSRIGVRIAQVEYLMTRFGDIDGEGSATQNGVRISTGVVIHF